MLKQRVLTAIVLIVLVLLGIFYLPPLWFAMVTVLIFLLAAWEWGRLIQLSALPAKIGLLVAVFLGCVLLQFINATVILVLGVVTWLLAGCALPYRHTFARLWSTQTWLRWGCGIWLLALAWYAINFIRWQPLGSSYLLLMLLWIWGADTGAFFVGRRFGKHKLAPAISPGKTWEGAFGGVVVVLLIALVAGMLFPFGFAHAVGLLILALIIAIISVIGDLFESLIKRQTGIKDSGTLLPGHGGVLDRLDSLISSAPVFALGLIVLQHMV